MQRSESIRKDFDIHQGRAGLMNRIKSVVTKNTCLQQPSPLFPNIFLTQCFNMNLSIPNYFNTERRLILLVSCEPWQHEYTIVFFFTKGHKIVEILALFNYKSISQKIFESYCVKQFLNFLTCFFFAFASSTSH